MGALKELVNQIESPAILLGNGINNITNAFPTWPKLLQEIAKEEFNSEGLTYPELANVIQRRRGLTEREFKEEVCKYFKGRPKQSSHTYTHFLDIVSQNKCPVLTTNFDLTLSNIMDLNSYRLRREGFNRYYLWDGYFSNAKLDNACSGFGIWHIHGSIKYWSSIRLNLSDYMGSVSQARKKVQQIRPLLPGNLPTFNTWLDIWFRKPLIIIGLKLEPQEVFIRWMIIERTRYFDKHGIEAPRTIYLCKKDNQHNDNFLSNMDIEKITVRDYEELYT
jgi:hypothetical protein